MRTPPSVEAMNQENWSTKEGVLPLYAPRHQQNIVHFVTGAPTTSGVVYTTASYKGTTVGSSKSSGIFVVNDSTFNIKYPGLEGFYVDELELGLTIAARSTGAQSTFGYNWQIKNSTGSTWQNITTYKTYKATTLTWDERTLSHNNVTVATGYNRMPLVIRLRAYSKSKNGYVKVKSSSYAAIKVKKTA
jgi:hypothetical protein